MKSRAGRNTLSLMRNSIHASVTRPLPGSGLGLASWAREIAAAAQATFAPAPYPSGLPRGNGETVLFIPGFLAGDWTMLRLRDFLVRLNYRVRFAGVGVNLGPTRRLIPQLEQAVARFSTEADAPIGIVGQSLGGTIGLHLAHRHPERISHVVTLCSPIRFPVATPLEGFANLLAPLHDDSAMLRLDEIAIAPPVPVTAIYSKGDGIIDWKSCLQDESDICRNVEVPGAHSSMGSNPLAQREIALALARISGSRE